MNPLNFATSLAATMLRTGAGVNTQPAVVQPEQMLKLYEFEGCPHCRLVREVLTELDLDALILPCPKGGDRFCAEVESMGGKVQFPFLVDPNTGDEMYESADIVRHLFKTYGQRKPPLQWQAIELQRIGSTIAGMSRLGQGMQMRAARQPALPLELFSFEASPFARPVRELLCEMQIPYILRSVGRAQLSDWVPPMVRKQTGDRAEPVTRNRRILAERMETISIPYLIDPNTNTELAESDEILTYLRTTYL